MGEKMLDPIRLVILILLALAIGFQFYSFQETQQNHRDTSCLIRQSFHDELAALNKISLSLDLPGFDVPPLPEDCP